MEILQFTESKPDRLTSQRNDEYHVKMARYQIGNAYSTMHMNWLDMCWTNRNFVFDNQWIMQEDLETFLKDGSDQSKNRIKVIINTIFRQVAQFMGNSKNMDMSIRAKNLSYKAINRREIALAEMLFFTEVAKTSSEGMQEYLKSKFPIGNSREETEEIFNNLWTDEYTKVVNNLIEYVFESEEFYKRRSDIAFDLSLTGLAVAKYDVYNNEFKIGKISPEDFFFDRSALEYDLSDAESMGHKEYLSPSTIYEKYQVGQEIKKIMESETKSYLGTYQNKYINNGKIPVYFVEWKDFEEQEYGYVKDEFDYPYLTKLNFTYEGEDKPRYTDKDLIPEKDLNETQKKVLKGRNKGVLTVDVVRYAHIIPSEILPSNKNEKLGYNDILLESGISSYADIDSYRPCNAKFTYKPYCWYYWKGYIHTPISSLINPQRIINRTESVTENLINTSLPAYMAYDTAQVDPKDGGEKGMLKNIYQGKMVGINAKGRGINNAIMKVGSSMDYDGIKFNSARSAEMMRIQDGIIGLNEPMRGEGTGSEQLVGVTALQIQRSSLIQEPFYTAIAQIYTQMGQAVANVARRLYAEDERKMATILGDKYAHLIGLAKELSLEAFRIFIHHEVDVKKQIEIANARLDQMLLQGIINKENYSNLFNRATNEDIAEALRQQVKQEKEIAKAQVEAEANQQANQQQIIQGLTQKAIDDSEQERTDKVIDQELNRQTKLQTAALKTQPQPQRNA